MRTRAEKRESQANPELVRAKRNMANLPDPWDDDRPGCHQKTWKVRRKTQYRPEKRGEKHSVFIDDWYTCWHIEQYCIDHDIPCYTEAVNEYYEVEVTGRYKYIVTAYDKRWLPCVHHGKNKETTWKSFNVPRIKKVWVPYKKPIMKKRLRTYGYWFTWWSDKDIGIDYLLGEYH